MPSGPLTLTSGKTGLLQRRSIFIIKVFKVFLCIVSQDTVVHYFFYRAVIVSLLMYVDGGKFSRSRITSNAKYAP